MEDWENDVEDLLQACSEIRDDLITTFDACLAQPTQRTDIVKFYMDVSHQHILKILADYWESYAIDLNPYQTLQLVDWAYQYSSSLNQFGCRDYYLYNGFLTLCNTYAIKIHSTLIPMILSILRQEANKDVEIELDKDGKYFTSAPSNLIKLFDEAFQVVRVKKIRELMLKMLHVYETITF